MKPRLAVLMDPIGAIKPAKDSTLALLLEATRRGYELLYLEQGDLALRGNAPFGHATALEVRDDAEDWYRLGPRQWQDLREVDLILARKDPPFDRQYLYDTMVLERAQAGGALVVNDPRALRDANEKLFALEFPECCTASLVARDPAALRAFVEEHGEAVIKPLDGMGGQGIFRTRAGDPNLNVILETVIGPNAQLAVAQRYLPEIVNGDKRILMIDGKPVDWCLARLPQGDDFRGNLARGGRGEGRPLTERDRWIAAQVGPELQRRGLRLVGLDVIGDWLTEINVTSPTCIRELDAQFGINIAGMLFDSLEKA